MLRTREVGPRLQEQHPVYSITGKETDIFGLKAGKKHHEVGKIGRSQRDHACHGIESGFYLSYRGKLSEASRFVLKK